MSTEITTFSAPSEFPILTAGTREAKILQSKLASGPISLDDLPSVKIPTGGATKFSYEVNGSEVSTDEIRGVVVAQAGRGVLWPTTQMGNGAKPLVSTHDLVVGYRSGDDFGDVSPETLAKFEKADGTYDWVAMSNSAEFGFGSAGRGKRVKESQIVAVLQKGELFPVLLRIPGGSLTVWNKFMKMVPCLNHEVVVSIKLEKAQNMGGISYARIKPSLVGTLTAEEGEVIEGLYTTALTEMLSRPPVGGSSGEPVGGASGEAVPF